MKKLYLLFTFLLFVVSAMAQTITPASGILYVKQGVAGGNQSGDSWQNAIPELADALKWANTNKANFTTTPLQIWVAGGTYKPKYTPEDGQSLSATPADPRDVSFLMVNNVQLYGGFAATETTLNERDLTLTANASILSGDLGIPNVDTDNAYHVVLRVGTPTTTLNAELNGFTITNGNADGNTTIQVNAGIIQKSRGGGIYNIYTSSDIMNVKIIKNKANYGAGMYNVDSQFKLINGLVVNNITTTDGGGIYNDSAGYVTVLNCTFYNNSLQDIHSTWGFMWVYNTILWDGIVGTNFADLTFNSCLFGVGLNASTVFTDAANGDFSLVNGSPAINAGNNQHWIANVGAITGNETDLAGNPRFVDVIDMGAYESQCSLSLTSSQTNVACNGSSNGTATVTVSGGIAPYTYSWSPTGGTSATATGLSAGNYEVTVTDANGCTVTETFTITQPAVVNPPTVVDEIICSPGDVTLVASSASGLIQWYDSETSETIISNGSSLFIPNLTSSKSYWVENQELNPTIYYGGEPKINLLKSPNDLNTFINWGLIFDTSENINLLGTDVYVSNAGTIQIKVVDAAGAEICTTGNIAVTVTGLSSSMTIPLDFYIPKGTGYKLLIKSFNGAKLYRDVNNSFPIVDSQNILTIKSGYFDAPTPNYYYYFYNIAYKKYCSSERKEVQAIVINTPVPTAANQSYCITEAKTVGDLVATGTDVKWYDSANGTTELTATTLLTTGTYYATQTLYGCESARTQIEVTVSNMINTISKVDVTCNGGNNGSATAVISGGVAPYTYVWNNGITSTTNEATNLAAGTYEVTVTDANGCILTETFTITETDVININLQETSFNMCSTCNDSNVVATITGGTAPYTYNWNDGVTTKDRSDLLNGTYTLTVTDAAGCTLSENIVVSTKVELPYRDFTYTNGNAVSELNNFTTCQSGAVVTASSGRYTNGIWYDGSYELFVNNISLGVFTGEETIDISNYIPITSVRAVGNHNFWSWTAIDVKTYSEVVDVPPTSPIVSNVYYELNSTAIPLTATLNGVGTTLKWYTDELGSDYSSSAPTPSTNQLGTTSYYVSQANSVGCESGRAKIDVIVVSPITYTHQINNLLCFTSTGSIDLSVFGGTGSYTYLWSNGATTEDITVSQGGNYTCTITDENSGFSITTQVLQVLQPLPLHVTIVPINVACFGGNNGEAIATVTNGTAPYTYSWNDVNNQTTPTATGLAAGTYMVTVTDANNCITTTTVTIAEPVLLEASIALANVVNVSCFDGNDGEATVTVSGGTAPYTYLWNDTNTQTTATATGLAAGTYTVTVTDANNCTTTTTVKIAEPTLLEASIALTNVVNVSCFDGNDGEATVTVSGGTAPYTYLWNDATAQTTATATGLQAGTYTVTVTDANNCTTTTNVTVTEPLVLEATIALANVVNVSCFDGNDGEATVTVLGGTAPYTYLWNDATAQTTATATGLEAGTYTVTVSDANNCTTTTNVTVTEPLVLEASIALTNVVNVSCFDGNDGSAIVTVSGGTAPHTYLWNDTNAQTTATAAGLFSGTYTVTVSDANNCTTTTNVTITEPLVLEASIALTNVVNVSCFDGNDGEATVTVTGGTAPYTYLWNDATAQTTATATGLAAGTYTVTVSDANNCTTTTNVTVTEPLVLEVSIALTNVVNVSCFDGNDGSAIVTVSGGTAPYTYLWNDTTAQTTATATGLAAGTYTVTVSDANNCTTTTNVTIAEPLVLEASIALTNVVNVSCFDGNDGEATVTVLGGTAPYTYLWNDATAQTTATATGLEAGTYTVTVSDANNCTTTTNVTVTEPLVLEASIALTNVVNVSCFDGNDGEATVTVTGGTAPYTYLWNDATAQTTATATGLEAGTYTVTVSDANNCTTTTNVTVTEPLVLEASIALTNVVNVSCFDGNDGEATVTVTGGTAPYTYLWNDATAQTTSTATGLQAGTYTVTVTDANNCTTTTTVKIAEPVLLEATIALTNVVNVSCFDGNDGSAIVTVSGGTAPYTYLWNDTNAQTTATATGLAAGTYTVTVSDANNCTTTTTVTIAEPLVLEASIALTNVVNVSCFDGNDGEATVTVTGGTAPYTYLWNDTNAQTTATARGLEAGTYTVTVSDANNCTTTTNVTIAEPLVLEASIALTNVVNVSCFDGNDGSAIVTVSGGTAPYTYLWNDATAQTTATAIGLKAGTYTVTVTDANNCTTTTTVTIAEPVLLEASIALANVVNVSCFDGNDGEATVTVSGGTAPYTYLWNDATAQTTATAIGLKAGTYTVTVTDANNCTTTTTVTIAEPTLLEASITLTNVVNVSCFDGNDGEATVTVSGGTAPYTYLWNDTNTQTTATATGLAAGTYMVTVTDANNCTTTTIVTIAEPVLLEASIALANVVNVSCFDGNDGSAMVTVSGGTAPYTYLWNDTTAQTTATATGLVAGTYTVTVTDANNCTTTTNVTIAEPLILEASITLTNVVNVSCFDGNDGEATVTVSGGTAPYTYLWNDATAQTTATATGLAAGTYTVTVTDANNCTTTTNVTIAEPTLLEASIALANVVNVSCFDGNDGSAMVTVSGGTAPYTYLWNDANTQTTATATGLQAGTYTVTVTDASNCTTTTTVKIAEPTLLEASIALANVVNVSCFDGNDGSAMVTVSGGTAPYTYLWNDTTAQTTATATGLEAATYMVTVTDANNCTTTTTVTIAEPLVLEASIALTNVVNVSCFDGNDGEAMVTVSGGTAPYTYLWNDATAQTTATATGLQAGTYTVTVTDANNCTTTETFTITEPTALNVVPTQTNVLCKGAATGSASVTVSGGVAPYTYTWDNGITSTTHEATDLSAGAYTVNITDANGCTSAKTFTITEPAIIPIPIVTTPIFYTYGDTALALDALVDNGNTLLWYDAATGGLGSTNAFIPSTDTIGTQTYWVSQLTADGCESERVAIEVNVSPAILIVMADENQTKVYGSADPVFTYTATGFQFNDNDNVFTGLLSRDPGENVGTYPIHQGSLSAGPAYTITFVEATFNITAAELIVTPNNGQTKVYGSADPVYQYTVSGFVAGDSFSVISGLLGRLPGENVGNYLYHSGTLTSVHNNYTFTVLPEYFIITPAPIDVVVNPGQHKMYGTSDPFFNYSALGLVNGDSPYTAFTGVLQRSMGENVGIYAINQGTLQTNANYQLISFTAADFEIVPALIANLQLNDATYVYDGTPKSLVVTGPVDPNAQITYTGNNQINAGTYTVTATVDYGSNYQQLVLTATLTIVRANQTIFFEIDSPVILEDTPPFNLQATATSGLPVHYTYTYSGIQPAEVSASGAVELLAPGEVHITAHQDGDNNYNAAVPVTRTLVIESRDSGIWDLYIDDEHFAQPADEIFVIKGCDDTNSASVEIRVETQIGATVSPSPIIIVPTPDYGIYEVEIVVTSQNGQHTKTYKVVIDKRLPWENILMQKYDNVVFINNNPATNGGYKFVRYEWYKNDVKVADQQLFSEGATMHDLIDLSASYHAVLYTDDGKVLTTCSMTIIHKHDYSLTVYPNPVVANGILNVTYDVPHDVFTAIDYVIFTTSGQFVSRGTLEQSAAQINLPATLQSGTYILVLNINGKNKSVRFVIK